ncbi:MAG: NADP-dependent oxidoreductase [bacterium]|nr:NADP-dependent oxidoreductase [bacterium]
MKAVVLKEFGGVENLADMDWPEPKAGEGQVKIRVKMVSVNPTDFKARRGGNQGAVPMVLGRDVAGIVEAVGDGVSAFAPGDEVMSYLPRFGDSGGEGYAEFVSIAQEFVQKKPPKLSFAQAAAVPLVALTAYEAVVMKANAGKGDSAFVAGAAGGVGTMGIPMLRHLGASPIITTAGSDKSAAYIRDRLGVPEENILRYAGLSLDEMAERITAMNGGRLPRLCFDFVGKDMKRLCAQVVDYWGHIVSIAPEPGDPIPEFFHSQQGPLFSKSASFHGVFLRAPVRGGGRPYWGTYQAALGVIREWLEAGHIQPPPTEDLGPLSAAGIAEAHRRLEAGHTQGKLVLSVG